MRVLKVLTGGILLSVVFVFGSMFLVKSCLSVYDERFALPPALFFEKDGKKVLVSLVQFNEAKSYSYDNGITHKSISRTYFIQANDATSGDKIQEREIKKQNEKEVFSVEVIGDANSLAWIFAGELLAFDPTTLERKVDVTMLEKKNPSLKGLFPKEKRFYQFNKSSNDIYITANDGTEWHLDCKTLKTEPLGFERSESEWKAQIEKLESEQKLIENQRDSMFMQIRNIKSSGPDDYYKKTRIIYARRDGYYKKMDSVRKLKLSFEQKHRLEKQLKSNIENLQRMNVAFSSVKVNQDTIGGKWYGLYSEKELKDLHDRVQRHSIHGETSRRNFYVTSYSTERVNEYLFDKEKVVIPQPSAFFLDGGFLLDKNTAKPIKLQNPEGFLVVSKDIIGNKGKIIITRISDNGKKVWHYPTGLQEWVDWRLYNGHLYVFGADNEEVSSECNFVQIVDLSSGRGRAYDYFEDNLRK